MMCVQTLSLFVNATRMDHVCLKALITCVRKQVAEVREEGGGGGDGEGKGERVQMVLTKE